MGSSNTQGTKKAKLTDNKIATKQVKSKSTIVIDDDNEADTLDEPLDTNSNESVQPQLESASNSECNNITNANSKPPTTEKPIIDMGVPLAEQMRPTCLEGYIGQERAVGKEKVLSHLLSCDTVPSMILWGPPGCGKVSEEMIHWFKIM